MAVITKYFDKYKIVFFSNYYSLQLNEFGVKNWIQIECYDNQTRVANLLFNENLTFGKNEYKSGIINLVYHIDRFDDIYNLIRREKPLHVVIDNQSLNGNVASHQLEPAGELDV
jgi:hypothetical protein